MSDQDEVARLKEAMWKRQFFLMSRKMKSPEKLQATSLAHYQWVISQEKEGRIFLSGPSFELDGTPAGGMTVLRVENEADARALAEADPFVAEGVVDYTLKRWQINEGSLQVRLDLSDMKGQAQ